MQLCTLVRACHWFFCMYFSPVQTLFYASAQELWIMEPLFERLTWRDARNSSKMHSVSIYVCNYIFWQSSITFDANFSYDNHFRTCLHFCATAESRKHERLLYLMILCGFSVMFLLVAMELEFEECRWWAWQCIVWEILNINVYLRFKWCECIARV